MSSLLPVITDELRVLDPNPIQVGVGEGTSSDYTSVLIETGLCFYVTVRKTWHRTTANHTTDTYGNEYDVRLQQPYGTVFAVNTS